MLGRVNKSFGFLRTTAVGGVLFLLPFVVLVVLLVYIYEAVLTVHKHLQPWIPFNSAIGLTLLFSFVIFVLLTSCFISGLMARHAIGKQFSRTVESQLMRVFPKYGIYRELLAGKIGGNENAPSLRAVLVKREGTRYLAFQADRLANGLIVVYFPGSPDTWSGSVALIAPEDVQLLDASLTEVLGICERLGRDSSAKLNAALAKEMNQDGANRG